MNAITNLLSRTMPQPWEKPTWTQPMVTPASALTPLGRDHRGREWFSHRVGELIERPGRLDETRDVLPDGIIVADEDGDVRTWRTFQVVAPGSWAALMAGPVRGPKAPRANRPADSLGHLFLRDTAVMRAPADHGSSSLRGPAGILARLSKAGAEVSLSADRASLVVSTPAGHLPPGVLELVDRAGPLLLAHLRGEPLTCTVRKHKAPEPAASLAVGGSPACAACLDGAA